MLISVWRKRIMISGQLLQIDEALDQFQFVAIDITDYYN